MLAKALLLVACSTIFVSLYSYRAEAFPMCDTICAMKGVAAAAKNTNCSACCQRHTPNRAATGTCGGWFGSKCLCKAASPPKQLPSSGPNQQRPNGRPQSQSPPARSRSGGLFGFLGGTCVKEVNQARKSFGLPAFTLHPKLVITAKTHNDCMIRNNQYGHDCHGQPKLQFRPRAAGFTDCTSIGEVLLAGNLNSCQRAVKDWLESPTHKEQMLHPKYTKIGCDISTSRGGTDWKYYYTCHFATVSNG